MTQFSTYQCTGLLESAYSASVGDCYMLCCWVTSYGPHVITGYNITQLQQSCCCTLVVYFNNLKANRTVYAVHDMQYLHSKPSTLQPWISLQQMNAETSRRTQNRKKCSIRTTYVINHILSLITHNRRLILTRKFRSPVSAAIPALLSGECAQVTRYARRQKVTSDISRIK